MIPQNFLLRMGQLMAGRNSRMNLKEKLFWNYRVQRIGETELPIPQEEKPKSPIATILRYYLQRLNELEEKLHKHLDKKGKDRYKEYT